MIISFRSRALQKLFEKGRNRRFDQRAEPIALEIMDVLDSAQKASDMDQPGYAFHALTGDSKGRYAVTVYSQWRITFSFKDGNAHEVDYEDYH